MTRWVVYWFNICHLQHCTFDQNNIKYAKVSSKFCQIVNEPFQKSQNFITSRQSGEILPNLVTLFPFKSSVSSLQLFEKKNQKSAQTIAQLQRKLEEYQRKLRDLEQFGVHQKPSHKVKERVQVRLRKQKILI